MWPFPCVWQTMSESDSLKPFSPDEIQEILLHLQQPAVFMNMTLDWPVLLWTADNLSACLGDKLIRFRLARKEGTNSKNSKFQQGKDSNKNIYKCVCACVSQAIYHPSLQYECVHETMNHPFGVIWITLATQSFSAVLEQNFPDWPVMIYRLVCCHLMLMKYWRLCNNLFWDVT